MMKSMVGEEKDQIIRDNRGRIYDYIKNHPGTHLRKLSKELVIAIGDIQHLFVLSLIAYKTLKTKRILYVSIAFAIFAIHTIVSRLNLFIPDIESSLLELILSAMEFVALALFFVAIIRKESVKTKTINI